MALITPEQYASLSLKDQFLEDWAQTKEIEWLLETTTEGESVIEMGWGSGLIAQALFDAGRAIVVVEGSAYFCDTATNFGIPNRHSMFEDYMPEGRYDCVIASFILEHIADPVGLLKRIRGWTDKLIVVVGNANSYHRQIAVKMGLQPHLDSLSERDKTVGHVRVYSKDTIYGDLLAAGWVPCQRRGLGFKPLPNSMLAQLPPDVAKTMMQMEVQPDIAANMFILAK